MEEGSHPRRYGGGRASGRRTTLEVEGGPAAAVEEEGGPMPTMEERGPMATVPEHGAVGGRDRAGGRRVRRRGE